MTVKDPPKPRASSTNSPASGRRPRVSADVRQFERFCSELNIGGKPFKLYPEQLEIVGPFFDGARESIVLVPKKNGKSTLVAALAIYHLLTTVDAECIIVAAARDQAEIILDQARKFIRGTRALQPYLRVMRREIQLLDGEGRARVLASDEDTADGVLPTLAIVDELHRHRTGDLYTILRLALGTTGGRMITISTAGATMASPLGEKRTRAYEMQGFVRDAKRRRSFVRSADGAFAFIEFSLNLDDDPLDMKIVKLVNPAPWKTPALLEEERQSVTPWQWLRFGCGIWTEGEEPWISPGSWDRLADNDLALDTFAPTWVGVDLGMRAETAALALVQVTDGKTRTKVRIINGTDLSGIEAAVREVHAAYPLRMAVFGSKLFGRSAEILEAEGVPMVEYPQSPERMVAASGTLHRIVEEGSLAHDGDQELRAQVLAGRVKESERGWRFVKDPNMPRPIDGLIALAIGAHAALGMAEPAPLAIVEWV